MHDSTRLLQPAMIEAGASSSTGSEHMRYFCLRLMTAYYHRGKMLLEAQESGVLSQLMQEEGLSNDEVQTYIALYDNWAMFLQAEAWNHGLYRRCPRTPIDGLRLIDRWVAAGSPRPLNIRGFVDSLLMAIVSVVSQSAPDPVEIVTLFS